MRKVSTSLILATLSMISTSASRLRMWNEHPHYRSKVDILPRYMVNFRRCYPNRAFALPPRTQQLFLLSDFHATGKKAARRLKHAYMLQGTGLAVVTMIRTYILLLYNEIIEIVKSSFFTSHRTHMQSNPVERTIVVHTRDVPDRGNSPCHAGHE